MPPKVENEGPLFVKALIVKLFFLVLPSSLVVTTFRLDGVPIMSPL